MRTFPLWLLSTVLFITGCGATVTGVGLLFLTQSESTSPNLPPTVLVLSPSSSETRNDLVHIQYQVFDPEGDPVNLTVEWSTDGQTWHLATPFPGDPVEFTPSDPTVGIPALPAGSAETYSFVWDSYFDALEQNGQVFLRLTPVDGTTGAMGQPAEVSIFLRNTYSTTVVGRISQRNLSLPYQPYFLLYDDQTQVLYISNKKTFTILRFSLTTGKVERIVGTGLSGFNGDNLQGVLTNINNPRHMCLGFDPVTYEKALFFCDSFNHRIRVYNLVSRFVTTLAGNGVPGYEEAQGVDPKLLKIDTPLGIRPVYLGDRYLGVVFTEGGKRPVVRFLNLSTQTITYLTGVYYRYDTSQDPLEIKILPNSMGTILGNGFVSGSATDQGWVFVTQQNFPTDAALLKKPLIAQIVWCTQNGLHPLLFVADKDAVKVANLGTDTVTLFTDVVLGAGQMKTLLGAGSLEISSGQYAPSVGKVDVADMVVFPNKGEKFSLILSEVSKNGIWLVDGSSGIVTRLAGGGSTTGDGGPALQAKLGFPGGLAANSQGLLFIAEHSTNRIRVVNLSNYPQTVAGKTIAPGHIETILQGPTLQDIHNLLEPEEILVAPNQEDVFVVDRMSHRVIRFNIYRRMGTAVVGNGLLGSSGDGGTARNASIGYPEGIALLEVGNNLCLLVTDNGDRKGGKVRIVNLATTSVTFGGVVNLSPGNIETLVGGGTTSWDSLTYDLENVPPRSLQLGYVLDVFVDFPPSGPPAVYVLDQVKVSPKVRGYRLWVYNPTSTFLTYHIGGGTRQVSPGSVSLLVTNLGGTSPPQRHVQFQQPGFSQAVGSAKGGDLLIFVPMQEINKVFVYNFGIGTPTIVGKQVPSGDFLDLTPINWNLAEPHSVFYIPNPNNELLGICDTGNHRVLLTFGAGHNLPLGTTVVAIGNGQPGYNGDVLPPPNTTLSKPVFVAGAQLAGKTATLLLISEEGTGRIRAFVSQ